MDMVLPPQLDVASFGEFLRRARERRGLTLEQISDETKIPRRHLDAIEHGDLSVIPGGMYRRAEVRAFAHVVGLDESLALAHLELALKGTSADDPRQAVPKPVAEPWRAGGRSTIALAVLAIVVVTLLAIVQRQTAPQAAAAPAEGLAAPSPATPVATPSPNGSLDETATVTPLPAPPPAAAATAAAGPADDGSAVMDRGTETDGPAASPGTAEAPGLEAPAAPTAADGIAGALAPTAPRSGRVLEVVTDPPGARVVVNGIGRGASPVTVPYLPAGQVRVRVVKDGFESQERLVTVAGGGTTAVSFSLQPVQR